METYSSKEALLSNIIDYAGTFPPAALALDEAMRQAVVFRKTARHPWLLSRITSKWSDIKTLHPARLFAAGADGSAWSFTALGSEVKEVGDWERVLEWDLREMRSYNARYAGTSLKIRVVGYETKVPDLPPNETAVRVSAYLDRFWDATGGEQDLYLELSFGENFSTRLTSLIESIGRWMEERSVSRWNPGLKFRTAGQYVPSPSEVALAVSQTTYARFKFKATQGLHEAVTHGTHFGFVNLFSALALSQALGSDTFGTAMVEKCLLEEKASTFKFGPSSFQWNEYQLSVEEIETARRFHCATFGSCSVDEPDESLEKIFP